MFISVFEVTLVKPQPYEDLEHFSLALASHFRSFISVTNLTGLPPFPKEIPPAAAHRQGSHLGLLQTSGQEDGLTVP